MNGLREFARITAGESRQLSLLHVGRNDEQDFFYYVMELADDVVTGRDFDPGCYAPLTLKVSRDQQQFLPAAQVVRYAIELARDLCELHATGLIHRDIKPSNIILVDGRPKLADIGLVTLASEALTYVGTEGFVPPRRSWHQNRRHLQLRQGALRTRHRTRPSGFPPSARRSWRTRGPPRTPRT
ncbi:MAG: protein kinase [Candidatus Synoicihabitans palmerolidicus]|nr:protein kinase [Candidatus Synoicihabitans palmerolidicus]